jgi:hypothetical protein
VDCDRFADVAAELALGVLTGRERAEAVPQLDDCDACREDVRELAITGEELLRLLPEVTPPAGFAYRVRHEICFSGYRRQRRRRAKAPLLVAAAAAAVLAVGGGLAGWSAVRSPGPGVMHPARLTTAQQRVIGRVFLDDNGYRGGSGWVYVSVDRGVGTGTGTVVCQLLGQDGRVTTIGSFGLAGGNGYWGSPESMPGTTVVGAQLLTAGGHVLATAMFGR